MDDTILKVCAGCDRVAKPSRITATGPYCGNCYRYKLVSRACTDCPKPTRWEPDKPEPLCRSCARKRQVVQNGCSGCGASIDRAEAWSPSGPICAKCYRDRREPKACEYCGRMTKYRSRAVASGIDKLACPGCLSKRLPKCRLCHRRFRKYPNQLETDVCSLCATGKPPRWHLCSCGGLIQNPYKTRCRNCEWRLEILPDVVQKLASSIKSPWASALFVEYCNEQIASSQHPSMLPRRFGSDLQVFVKIAAHVPNRKALTTLLLLSVLGPNFHIRHKRVNDGLIRLGAIDVIEEYDRRLLTLERAIKPCFDGCEGTWKHEALKNFYEDMLKERRAYTGKGHTRTTVPLSPTTIRAYVQIAYRLFNRAEAMGATSVTAITQHHLDTQLAKTGWATANSYRRVVRYLNTRTKRFKKLTAPSYRGTGFSSKLGLSTAQFGALVGSLLNPEGNRDLGYSLVCLLCLLYAQQPHKVVSAKTGVVRLESGAWQYRPAGIWLEVPPRLGELIRRWLLHIERSDAVRHGQWLFPGKSLGQHLGTGALYLWLVERGMRPKELFPSAISNLIRQGVNEVSVLHRAYGIPTNQANFILKKLIPISEDRAMALLQAGGRRGH